jgi:hypothetical protein
MSKRTWYVERIASCFEAATPLSGASSVFAIIKESLTT